LIAFLTALSGCSAIPAQYRTSKLALQKSGLGPHKYTYDNSAPARVYGFVTYSASFKDLLSRQPAALAEASRAVPYHYVVMAMNVGTLVYGGITIANVLSEAEEDPVGGSAKLESMMAVAVANTVLGGVLGYAARNHMLRAVDIFNREPAAPGSAASGLLDNLVSAIPNTIQLDPVRQRVGIGWSLPAHR